MPNTAAPHPRQNPRRAILWIGLCLSLIALLIGLLWGLPAYGDGNPNKAMDHIYPPLGLLPLFAISAGFGLALPVACLWINRAHLHAILRFTWGRAVASLIMLGLLPAGFSGIFPAPLWVVLSTNLFAWKHPPSLQNFFMASPSPVLSLLYAVAAILVTTVFSCALIYGLRKRWRVPAFVALWFGFAAALVLGGFGFGFSL